MKKKTLALLVGAGILTTGCTTADLMMIDGDRYFQVFQVVDEGILARRCTNTIGDDYCSGMFVFMPKGVEEMPYDKKIFHLDNPQIVDTYTYTTVKGVQKTVPVIVNKPRQ